MDLCCFFFFASRRRHTRCSRDWSSDVCSSDLVRAGQLSRVVHGWYKTGPASTGDQAIRDRIAAMLHRAPKLTASNESAIVIHGLPLVYSRDTNVQLTRNAVTGARREKGRVVHARPLAEHEVVEIDG